MGMTARLDLSVWRNDDVYEYGVEVRGLDLRPLALAMQIRLDRDVPGLPLVDLVKVDNGNAEGLRVAGVRTDAGVIISDLRIRLNRSTRQGLPYSGELGDSSALQYALLIGGRTRLVGQVIMLAHAYGSDAAPTSRPYGLATARAEGSPSNGAVVTIVQNEVAVLSIEGLDQVQPMIARAETAAQGAEAAQGQADAAAALSAAARDAAMTASRTFPTVAAGVAASADGQYFTVVGGGGTALSVYRREGGAGSLKTSLPSIVGMSAYGTVAQVAAGVQQDQSVAINALLADPGTLSVILPEGVVWVSRTVRVPAAKKLILQARTVIRALPSFAIVDGLNHIVLLEGSRAEISGGEVDANKVGLGAGSGARINGITVLNGARDCVRTGVVVRNCTGYAVYDSGTNDRATPPSSFNERLRVFNSQIHYEPQGADGTTYTDCTSGDGDGDIPCLSWLHPLVGSKNITWVRFKGYGATPAGADFTANIADLENISVIDSAIQLTNDGGIAFSVPPGWLNVLNLSISGSTFISRDGIGGSFQSTTGKIVNSTFVGGNGVEATDSTLEFVASVAKASRASGATQASFGIIASGGDVRWNAGSLDVTNPNGAIPAQGPIIVSNDTKIIPTPPAESAPRILQQIHTQALPVIDGGNSYVNVFPLQNVVDATKVQMTISIRKLTAGYSAIALPMPSWSMVEVNFFRVYFRAASLDPAEYRVGVHFIEYE